MDAMLRTEMFVHRRQVMALGLGYFVSFPATREGFWERNVRLTGGVKKRNLRCEGRGNRGNSGEVKAARAQ